MGEEGECTIFGEEKGDIARCNAVIIIKRCVGSFSLIGCLFMIGVIWLFRKYRLFVQRLILYMTVAALIDSTAYMMQGFTPDGPYCTFKSFWISFLNWAVLLWVSCITINLYLNAVRYIQTEKYEIIYHAIVWGISLVMACLPFIGDQYGPAGAWCWIEDNAWRFAMWYIPLFIIIIIMFIMYAVIIYSVTHQMNSWQGTYDPDISRNREMLKEYVKPLRAYPFIYLVLSIFPLINRIQNAARPNHPVFFLTLMQAISSPLLGFVNAVVYGLDPETKSMLNWNQIKAAWYKKTDEKPIIEPYHITTETPVNETLGSHEAQDGGVDKADPSVQVTNADMHVDPEQG